MKNILGTIDAFLGRVFRYLGEEETDRGAFAKPAKVAKKTEARKHAASFEEISAYVKSRIKKSGCGCFRYGARALYNEAQYPFKIENIRLYSAIREYLNSYCQTTGSSYSSNNTSTIRLALERCDDYLLNHSDTREAIEEVPSIEIEAIGDLANNFSPYVDEKFVMKYLDRAKSFASRGNVWMTLRSLKSADRALRRIRDENKSSVPLIGPEIEKLALESQAKFIPYLTGRVQPIDYRVAQAILFLEEAKVDQKKEAILGRWIRENRQSHEPAYEGEVSNLEYAVKRKKEDIEYQIKRIERRVDSLFDDRKGKAENNYERAVRMNKNYPSRGNALEEQTKLEEKNRLFAEIEQEKRKETVEENTEMVKVYETEARTIGLRSSLEMIDQRRLNREGWHKFRREKYELGKVLS